jgi:Flp pilus assembly pilin Flp
MGEHVNRVIVSAALEVDERIRDLRRSERGQAFVEYALLLLVVAVAVAALADWGAFKGAIGTALTKIENALKNS